MPVEKLSNIFRYTRTTQQILFSYRFKAFEESKFDVIKMIDSIPENGPFYYQNIRRVTKK